MAARKIKNESADGGDYRLIGIASSLKEYKLCFHLNHILECDLNKLNDLNFEPTDRTRKSHYSVFRAGEASDKNRFFVFSNKNLGDFLLPEVSHFDYILRIEGKLEDKEMKKLAEEIKQLPEVVMSTEIPLKKIKNKDRLMYEEEKTARKLLVAHKP